MLVGVALVGSLEAVRNAHLLHIARKPRLGVRHRAVLLVEDVERVGCRIYAVGQSDRHRAARVSGCFDLAVVGVYAACVLHRGGNVLAACGRCGVCIADGQRFAVGLQGLRRKGRAILLRDERMVFVRACGNGGKRARHAGN